MTAVAVLRRSRRPEKARWTRPVTDILRHPTADELAGIGGRRGLPLVGVMPEVLIDPMGFFARMAARHGPVYRFRALGKWHLHLVGPEANELLLFDAETRFSAEEGWGPLMAPLFPGALLTRDGEAHRSYRRLLGAAFRQTELQGYRRIFVRDVEARCRAWKGRDIDLFPEAKALTFDIAASTFLGLSLRAQSDQALKWFGQVAGGLLSVSYDPRWSRARARALRAKRELERLLAGLVERRRAEPSEDFLSRLARLRDEKGEPMPVREICDALIFLLVAAHDTMSSALTSSLYYLAAHPEWAERLRAELAEAGIVCAADAAEARLPLQEMFYKEALRLNPPAPIVWRRAARAFAFAGRRIPAGTMTGANLMLSHRIASVWPDPLRFDPLRFAPEAEKARHRFAYAPFGAGVHKCLGMHFSQQQAKVLLSHLLLEADLRLASDRPPLWYHWPSCRPRGALRVSVAPRCPGR